MPHTATPTRPLHRSPRLRRRVDGDVLATAAVSALLVLGALCTWYSTMWAFALSTSNCAEQCRENYVGHAIATETITMVAAMAVAFVGIARAAAKQNPMVIWPLVGVGIVVVGTTIAFQFSSLAAGG